MSFILQLIFTAFDFSNLLKNLEADNMTCFVSSVKKARGK